MHFTQQSGWDEFVQEVKILEKRSLHVRKIRELSNKDLYYRAAEIVALLNPPFPNEYKLIKEARNNLTPSENNECCICLDNIPTQLLCSNAHLCCKQCVSQIYETSKNNNCPVCRNDLLPPI